MNIYKHDYENLIKRIKRKSREIFFRIMKEKENTYPFYASYRHRNKKPNINKKHKTVQYMTQEPNYSAGFGHGIDVWRNGIINASILHLEYAYTPMVSREWEEALGFAEGEKSVEKLKKEGYREVLLPYYDLSDEKSTELIRSIIGSYYGEKIIFKNEFEQDCRQDRFMIGADHMRKKFWNSTRRKKDRLIYKDDEIPVAVHIRRGDVSAGLASGREEYRKRWLDEDYYVRVMNTVISSLKDREKIRFYIFSEGREEEFPKIGNMETKIRFCLDMSAVESFIHMCYAKILIVGVSSFSYDPGLINPFVKIVPKKLWNPIPDNGEWIIADNEGNIPDGNIDKISIF